MSAASALIYEVVATNVLLFYFVRSSYSIATVLSIFLFGLGLGSFLIYQFSSRIRNPQLIFGFLQILIGSYAFFVFGSLINITPKFASHGIIYTSVVLLLIPTICLGAIFPLAGQIYKKENRNTIGLIYFIDIIGAVAGSLAAGFWLIPVLGNTNTILIGAVLNIFSATIIAPKKLKIIPLVLFLGIVYFFGPKYYQKTLAYDVKFLASSPYGEIKVVKHTLTIDGRVQCRYDSDNNQGVNVVENEIKNLGENPKILNIGLGCGGTLTSLTNLTNEKVDVVEINPVVVEATRKFSDSLNSSKVNLIIDDGLKYLAKTDKKYDVIVMVIDDPQALASTDLYTSNAFKIYQARLDQNGFFTFLPIIQDVYCLDVFYYSLRDVFPYVYLENKDFQQMFLASLQKKDLSDYLPNHITDINSLDRNVLQKCYSNRLKL